MRQRNETEAHSAVQIVEHPEKYLTSAQVAGLLGISRSTLDARIALRKPELEAAGYLVIDGRALRRFKQQTGLKSRAHWLALFPWAAICLIA